MLGWFKKKFGKQTATAESVETEPQQEAREEARVAPVEDVVTAPAEEAVEQSAAELEQPVVETGEAVGEETVAEEPAEPEPVEPGPEPSSSDLVAVEPIDGETVAEEQDVEAPHAGGATSSPEITAFPEEPGAFPESTEEAALSTGDEEPDVAPETDDTKGLDVAGGEATEDEVAANDVGESVAPGLDRPVAPAAPLVSKTQEKPATKSLFQRLQERLGKTRDSLVYRLDRLFLGKKEIDQDLFEQLEEILITADLGVGTTLELLDAARKKVKRDQLSDPQALKTIIRDQILTYIEASEQPAELVMPEEGPFVIMVVGVNGVGKTTTIGKIAAKFVRAGQSVLMVAGDTFRAAAINQLRIWGERVGVEVIAQKPGADPSSVVFDGLEYGVAHRHDVILIDTAGRLHTSVNLMEELKKIKRVIGKKMPGAPHEVMLVLDATTGQNGISQAKLFHEAVGVSGLTLTKLDGTAKGGIVANVCRETKIPVRFIGIGEQIDDLRDFEAREFVDALFAGREEG